MKRKGFTLIELIAVLVILAMLTLIVTPLVLNIIRKAKITADRRSVDAYGKSIELAIASYILEHEEFPKSIDDLNIEYKGKKVECEKIEMDDDLNVFLNYCKVGRKEIKDSSTNDHWYHYGTPSSDIEYKVGDQVSYKEIDFYVIKSSKKTDSSVLLLKAEPIKKEEALTYGTEVDYLLPRNKYNDDYIHSAYLYNDLCTSISIQEGSNANCNTNYDLSSVKQIVDAWTYNNIRTSHMEKDYMGYYARLMSYEELKAFYNLEVCTGICFGHKLDYEWLYSSNYWYWTMSTYEDDEKAVWSVNNYGNLVNGHMEPGAYISSPYEAINDAGTVRPVVNINKAYLDKK